MQEKVAFWKTKIAKRSGSPERDGAAAAGDGEEKKESAYMSPERKNSIMNEALDDSA